MCFSSLMWVVMSFCTLVFPKFYVVPLRFIRFYFLPWHFRNFILYPPVFEILSHALDILKFFTMPSLFRFYVWSTCFLPCLYILFQYYLCPLWWWWWPFSSSSSVLVLYVMVLLFLLSFSSSFLFSFSDFIFSWPPLSIYPVAVSTCQLCPLAVCLSWSADAVCDPVVCLHWHNNIYIHGPSIFTDICKFS